uniref:Uncharacterized protein n=1 Tax=Anguilla anguilla TaxID=7936 RepID=A0A0E9TZV0_ANGAN
MRKLIIFVVNCQFCSFHVNCLNVYAH